MEPDATSADEYKKFVEKRLSGWIRDEWVSIEKASIGFLSAKQKTCAFTKCEAEELRVLKEKVECK